MSEPNQFLVDYEVMRRRYERISILGNGKDCIEEKQNMLSVVLEGESKKRRVEQVFTNVNQDFLEKKLVQIHNSLFTFFTPDTLQVMYYGIREVSEKSQDLIIIYDFPEQLTSLEEIIYENQKNKLKFTEEEVIDLITSILETYYMGSRFSAEYLDIQPQNIFVDSTQSQKSKYILSNFGIQRHKRFECKLYNTNDKMYQKGFSRQNNNDAYIRSGLFQLGFLAYLMLSQEDANQYYNLGGRLLLENLQKDVCKLKQTLSEKSFKIINGLLQREETRLTIKEMVKDNILETTYNYVQDKNETKYKMYSGFIKNQLYVNMGDLCTLENDIYKGAFNDQGQYHGMGVMVKDQDQFIYKGLFINGIITQGTIVQINDNIYIGEIQNNQANGEGVKLSLLINNNNNYYYQQGQFKDGVLSEGITYYQNQEQQQGYNADYKVNAKKINNIIQYKQVQSFKLAKMNTQELQMAVKEIRKKHYGGSIQSKQVQSSIQLQQQQQQSQVNMMVSNMNNNSSQAKLQVNKQFRGEGLLFIHVVGCRDLKIIQSNKQQQQSSNEEQQKVEEVEVDQELKINSHVNISLNNGVNREFNTKQVEDNVNPIYHFRDLIKIKLNRDQTENQEITMKVMVEGYKIIGKNSMSMAEIYYKGGIWINKFIDLFIEEEGQPIIQHQVGQVYIQMQWRPYDLVSIDKNEPVILLDTHAIQQKQQEKLIQQNQLHQQEVQRQTQQVMLMQSQKQQQQKQYQQKQVVMLVNEQVLNKLQQTTVKPKFITGDLIINIVNSLNLRPKDYMGITDSFIKCTLFHQNQQIHQFDTNWITNSNDPRWDFNNKIRLTNLAYIDHDKIKFNKNHEKKINNTNNNNDKNNFKPNLKQSKLQQENMNLTYNDNDDLQDKFDNKGYKLQLQVYDYQTDNLEFLGQCEFNIDFWLANSGQWFNQIINLKDSQSNSAKASIYVQMLFKVDPQFQNQDKKQEQSLPNKLR